jgi:hypothetical protein
MDLLKDELIVELLSIVHKCFLPYYSYYCDTKGLMNSEGYLKFCHDFGIFPDVLNRNKVMKIFKTLGKFY